MIVLLCAFVPLCLCAFAESPTDLYTKANRAFASGHYADAIRDYEAIATREGVSAPLLFNLANTYFRDGKIGRAILCYEKALWLAPHDADIEANLRLVRKASGLFAPDLNWWQHVAHLLSMDAWTWVGSISFTLWCILMTIRLLSGNAAWAGAVRRNGWRGAFLVLGMVLAGSVGAIGILATDLDHAIVTAPETPLRISPYDTANSSGTLMTGELVHIQKNYENYVYVRTPWGRMGWVSNQQVERIVR